MRIKLPRVAFSLILFKKKISKSCLVKKPPTKACNQHASNCEKCFLLFLLVKSLLRNAAYYHNSILFANGRQGEKPLGRSVLCIYHWHTSMYSTHTIQPLKARPLQYRSAQASPLQIKKKASLLFFINSS